MSSKHQLALEKELLQLTAINSTVESVISTVRITQKNILKAKVATDHSGKLLEEWIKILSQADFTNRVFSDPDWNGLIEDARGGYSLKMGVREDLRQELLELNSENAALEARVAAADVQNGAGEGRSREGTKRAREAPLGASKRRFVK